MQKKRIVFILLAFCMMLAMSATAMAATTREVQEEFRFVLLAGGDKAASDPALKRDIATYARIEFKEFNNPTGYPLLYRLRSYPGDSAVSNLYEVNSVTTQRPVYWSGWGIDGCQYLFKIQTDSSSAGFAANTRGIWVP